VQAKQVAKGDVRVEVRSPFQMFHRPDLRQFPRRGVAIEESIKSQEYVLRRFGVKLKRLTRREPRSG